MGRASKWLSTSTQASLIGFAAIWGTLAREGLTAVATFDGQPLAQSVLWAQAVGCLIMGWAATNKGILDRPRIIEPTASGVNLFGVGAPEGKTLPVLGLHVALTTGFCGSVTTFSTWILQGFLAFSNHGLYHRSGFFSFVDGITQMFLTLVVSLMCLRIGMLAGSTWLSLDKLLTFYRNPGPHLHRILRLDPIRSSTAPSSTPIHPPATTQYPVRPGTQERLTSSDAHNAAQESADMAADELSSIFSRRSSGHPHHEAQAAPHAKHSPVPEETETASPSPATHPQAETKLEYSQGAHNEQSNRTTVDWMSSFWARMTTIIALLIGPAFWIGSALLLALYDNPRWRHVTWALLFAPVGAWTRWQLSVWYNPIPPPSDIVLAGEIPTGLAEQQARFRLWRRKVAWPLGTLIANVSATAVLAGMYTAQHIDPHAPPDRTRETAHASAGWGPPASSFSLGCGALYGVQEGFCACLSTISTFAMELDTIRPRRKGVYYAFASYILAVLFCILLVGIPTWVFDSQGKTAYGPSRCPSLKY